MALHQSQPGLVMHLKDTDLAAFFRTSIRDVQRKKKKTNFL